MPAADPARGARATGQLVLIILSVSSWISTACPSGLPRHGLHPTASATADHHGVAPRRNRALVVLTLPVELWRRRRSRNALP